MSSTLALVAVGNSVSPQLLTTPSPPSSRRMTSSSPGGLGAPPADARTQPREQLLVAVLALRGEVRLEQRQRGPEEASRRARAMKSGRLLGVERRDQQEPLAGEQRRGERSPTPPMCEIGKPIGYTSSGVGVYAGDERVHAGHDRRVGVPHALRVSVDPDVWYSQRAGNVDASSLDGGDGSVDGSALGNASSQVEDLESP